MITVHRIAAFVIFALTVLPVDVFAAGSTTHGETEGSQIYLANCAKCHGRQGEGFLRLYPPLTGSRYFSEDIALLPCIIRDGMRGPIEVNGQQFNGIMPGNKRLSSTEMTTLANWLQTQWGQPERQKLEVDTWLKECPK